MIFFPYLIIGALLWLVWIAVASTALSKQKWKLENAAYFPLVPLGALIGLGAAFLGLCHMGPNFGAPALPILPVALRPAWYPAGVWAMFLALAINIEFKSEESKVAKAMHFLSAGTVLIIPMLPLIFLAWQEELLRAAGISVGPG